MASQHFTPSHTSDDFIEPSLDSKKKLEAEPSDIVNVESLEAKLEPILDESKDSRLENLLESIRNAKISSEGGSQLFKTKEEDTYSDVDYENYPNHYWKTDFEVEENL